MTITMGDLAKIPSCLPEGYREIKIRDLGLGDGAGGQGLRTGETKTLGTSTAHWLDSVTGGDEQKTQGQQGFRGQQPSGQWMILGWLKRVKILCYEGSCSGMFFPTLVLVGGSRWPLPRAISETIIPILH